jgi:hypothetical protein
MALSLMALSNGTQHNDSLVLLSIHYAECNICSVNNKPFMLSVIMLSVVMLSVTNKPYMLSVVLLSVVIYAECRCAMLRSKF